MVPSFASRLSPVHITGPRFFPADFADEEPSFACTSQESRRDPQSIEEQALDLIEDLEIEATHTTQGALAHWGLDTFLMNLQVGCQNAWRLSGLAS